ncbi:hypothetical protein HY406_01195 [Candidatus Giovannonibacteria bacterium]|nr:hypothetical protein [Candidatus Giovannonibacteria bacterium]
MTVPDYARLFGKEIPMRPVTGKYYPAANIRTVWDPKPYEEILPPALQEFRDEIVKERLEKGQRISNGAVAVLSAWRDLDGVILLRFSEGKYFDCVATHYELDRPLLHGMGFGPLRGYIRPEELFEPDGYERYTWLSKLAGITAVLETKDRALVLQERSAEVAVEANSFHVSIAEGLKPAALAEGGLKRAFAGALRQELGSSWSQEFEIVGGALGISDQYLQPDIALYAKLPLTADEVRRLAESARGRWERVRLHFVESSEESLSRFIEGKHFSPHATFALATAEALKVLG